MVPIEFVITIEGPKRPVIETVAFSTMRKHQTETALRHFNDDVALVQPTGVCVPLCAAALY